VRYGFDGRLKEASERFLPLYTAEGTRLHEFCKNSESSEHLILAHLRRYPSSASFIDSYGRTPLFWAVKRGIAEEAIRRLYQASPASILAVDICGETALDLLVLPKTENHTILEWLLDQDSSLAMTRSHSFSGMSLVRRVCGRWALSNTFDGMERVCLTVRAAHRHSFSSLFDTTSTTKPSAVVPLLHMAMELSLPSFVLHRISQARPDELRLSSPFVPLHYFISDDTWIDDPHAVTFLQHLLELHPCAAHMPLTRTANGSRSWALHAAICSGFSRRSQEALYALVQTAPAVLHKMEEEKRLLPFQLAATLCNAAVDDETLGLDVIYELLREQPTAICG
jgi:hypothetical protein